MKKLITMTIVMVILSAVNIKAENNIIMGKLVSQSSTDLIPGAIVTLFVNDSIPKAQVQSDESGAFRLDSVPGGRCLLRITALGYKPEVISVIGKELQVLNLGYIYLSESSVNLTEVTVYGTGIIEKVDKYIVLPDREQIERTSRTINLLDGLDLPGLRVNSALQKITIDDRTPVYQINGREQPLTRILNINPKDIVRIEYSNVPGIRYLDRNVAGVINFVLKERSEGGSFSGWFGTSLMSPIVNANLTGTYNKGKSEFSLTYGVNWRKDSKRFTDSYSEYIKPESVITRSYASNASKYAGLSQNIIAGYTYQRDPFTMFSVNFNNSIYSFNKDNNGTQKESVNSNIQSEYKRYSNNDGSGYTPSLDIFFSKKFKKQQTLELNLTGTFDKSEYKHYLKYEPADGREIINNNAKDNGWTTVAEAVYGKEFKKITTKFGTQYTHTYSKSEYEEQHQRSKLVKDNIYTYGEIKGKIKKVSYSLGTGVKVFTIDNNSERYTTVNNITTGNLLIPLAKKWSLNYLMLYEPTFPSLSNLSNVSQTVDNIMITEGNPNLKPLNWLRNRVLVRFADRKGFTLALWAIYDYTFNPIVTSYSYDPYKDMFITKPVNGTFINKCNLQANVGYQNFLNHFNAFFEIGWLRSCSKGSGYEHMLSNVYADLKLHAYWGNWFVGTSFQLLPKKELKGESITTNYGWSMIWVEYKLKNVYVSLYLNNPFGLQGYKYKTENLSKTVPSKYITRMEDDKNGLMLNVNYQLNFGKGLKKSKKTLNNTGYDGGLQKAN